MFTISLLFGFLGSFCWYCSSKRIATALPASGIEKWLRNRRKLSQSLAALFVIMAFYFASIPFNFVIGFFFTLSFLLLINSFIVMILPLKKISYKGITLVCIALFLIETFL